MNSLLTPDIAVVFYVDDDRADLNLMKYKLQGDKEFDLMCESSPSRALDYIQDTTNRLDLLISDCIRINETWLVTQARMCRPYLPIVGVTRHFDSKEINEIKEVTDFFIEKTPDFFRNADALVHAILETYVIPRTIECSTPSREALVSRAIYTAMQRWYDLQPNNVHVSPELMDDPNFQAFMLQKAVLEILYPIQYVAFANGRFFDHDTDQDALLDRVYKSHEEPVDVFIQKLAKPRIVDLPSPRR